MDTSPIPGFITRRQASEKCKRAERTLQRYWSRAIEQSNTDVLEHLKLRTEDGEIIDGPDVTKDLIDKLKKSAKNPTWYVHAVWVEKTYGPRVEDKQAKGDTPPADAGAGESREPSHQTSEPQVVALLQQRIAQLEQDKQDLRGEMKIKNDQINQANERDRETHHLMRDLHELLRDMQQRLPAPFAPLPAIRPEIVGNRLADIEAVQTAATATPAQPLTAEKGTEVAAKKRRSTIAMKRKAGSTRKRKKKTSRKKPVSVFQKHTPTFHKAASRLFRHS